MASLQEYGLVDPDNRRVEVFRIGTNGLWTLHDMSDGAELELASIECRIPMTDLFDGIDPG
jgi:Uma2 family endonuclease